jgi:hypothetical protein
MTVYCNATKNICQEKKERGVIFFALRVGRPTSTKKTSHYALHLQAIPIAPQEFGH